MAEKLIQITVKATVKDAEAKLKEIEKALGDFEKRAKQAGASVDSSMSTAGQSFWRLENVAKLAMGAMTSYIAKMALDTLNAMADQAAANMEVADSFERLANRYDLAADEIVAALKRASKGTVSEQDLILQANKAMRLGVATTVDEFEQLMKVAYVRSKEFGISVAEAWEYIVVGIGRASPMILDNIGILMDAERTFTDYAESIGKTRDELTKYEEKEAIRSRILQDSQQDLQDWDRMHTTAADNIAIMNAEVDEAKQKIGEYAAVVKGELAVALVKAAEAGGQAYLIYKAIVEGTYAASYATEDYRGWLGRAAVGTGENIEMQQAYERALRDVLGITDLRIEGLKDETLVLRDLNLRMAEARYGSDDLGESQGDLAEETDKAAAALDRAADAAHDYALRVERETWQFTSRLEQLQFSQTQAAEDAAFRRAEIERDAAQRSADLWEKYELDQLNDLERHQMKMRWMEEDHLDALADLEYEYQQDKKQLLDEAPWWVRNALKDEFAERERIARTGDKEALAEYDKHLLEKIRAVDPAYAKQFQKLQDQYKHEKDLENRESKQALHRQEEQFKQEERAQERQFRLQLRQIERELGDQLDAWEFHDKQRRENEERAMEQLRIDHEHQLDLLREDLEYKLGQLPNLWKHAGYTSWIAWLQGLNDAQSDYGFTPMPYPGYDPFENFVNPFSAQFGMPYVPRTMRMLVHQGEAILPPQEAQQYRAGGITIGEIHVHGSYTPFLAKKVVGEIATELGKMTAQRSR